jgi:DNA-directed RNA polymerase sigma subunit (sigma70/sigma32)
MNQHEYADFVGTSITQIQRIEMLMGASSPAFLVAVDKVAMDIGVSREEVWPDWLNLVKVVNDVRVANMSQRQIEEHLERGTKAITHEVDIDIMDSELKDKMRQILKDLTSREREILKLRYGIGEDRTYTLKEVGRKFNVTYDRVRQIEAKALRKLQHPCRSNKLKGVC